jgi:hypothetical protein
VDVDGILSPELTVGIVDTVFADGYEIPPAPAG